MLFTPLAKLAKHQLFGGVELVAASYIVLAFADSAD